jgi:hypothetical protein
VPVHLDLCIRPGCGDADPHVARPAGLVGRRDGQDDAVLVVDEPAVLSEREAGGNLTSLEVGHHKRDADLLGDPD